MARALEYKWNQPFVDTQGWSLQTLFKLRNANELWAIYQAMNAFDNGKALYSVTSREGEIVLKTKEGVVRSRLAGLPWQRALPKGYLLAAAGVVSAPKAGPLNTINATSNNVVMPNATPLASGTTKWSAGEGQGVRALCAISGVPIKAWCITGLLLMNTRGEPVAEPLVAARP